MKMQFKIVALLLSAVIATGCDKFGDRQNPLYGIIYKDKKEVPSFNDYEDVGGSVMDHRKDESNDYEFGISHLSNGPSNILTFESFIREPDNPQPKYQILDTIHIDNIKENEYITYCHCRQDTLGDPEILAVVIADEEKEYFDRIVRAWRADTRTGKIIRIKNTAGINCVNGEYGYDGDGVEE